MQLDVKCTHEGMLKMNNFTKEELQELLSLLDNESPLKNKIQALIVNHPKPDEPVSHRFIVKPGAVPCLTKNKGKIELYKIHLD